MIISAETIVYEPAPPTPHQNYMRPQPGTISTGAWIDTDPRLPDQAEHPEFQTLLSSTGEFPGFSIISTIGYGIGYYVCVEKTWPFFADEIRDQSQWVLTPLSAQLGSVQPLIYGMDVSSQWREGQVVSLASQREERRATATVTAKLQSLLPDFSEGDLARLAGVSRVAWRSWTSGSTVARRATRQRLLRLERILAFRQRVDSDTPLSQWLDSPVGLELDLTPARLLAEGRDQLAAILAARVSVPDVDGPRLNLPPELTERLNQSRVDERLALRRAVLADDEDEDS